MTFQCIIWVNRDAGIAWRGPVFGSGLKGRPPLVPDLRPMGFRPAYVVKEEKPSRFIHQFNGPGCSGWKNLDEVFT